MLMSYDIYRLNQVPLQVSNCYIIIEHVAILSHSEPIVPTFGIQFLYWIRNSLLGMSLNYISLCCLPTIVPWLWLLSEWNVMTQHTSLWFDQRKFISPYFISLSTWSCQCCAISLRECHFIIQLNIYGLVFYSSSPLLVEKMVNGYLNYTHDLIYSSRLNDFQI